MESPCRAFRYNSAGSRDNQMVLSSSPTQCLAVTSPSQLEGGNPCCGVGTPAPLVMVDTAVNPCPCRPSGACLDITQQQTPALTFQQRLTVPESSPVYSTGFCGISTPNFHGDSSGLFTLGCHPATESFFASPVPGFETKEPLDASWRLMPYSPFYYPYEMSGYSLAASYGMDWNGARRKNATRETTSTLKAWLNEHRKNPYPTKGEKIMLAIITKMTLTQVSTWFANARRRLKKENKMTWEPRNICDEDCDADSASDREDSDAAEKTNPTASESSEKPEAGENGSSGLFSISKKCEAPSKSSDIKMEASSVFTGADKTETMITKPRIWSIAAMATSTDIGDNFSYHNQTYPSAPDLISTNLKQQYTTSRWPTDSPRPSSFTRVTPSFRSLCDSSTVPSYSTRLKNPVESYSAATSTPVQETSDLLSSDPSAVQITDEQESSANSTRLKNEST